MHGNKAPNLNIAFGLTSYDNNYEAIDDPNYATLRAQMTSWSPEVDTTFQHNLALHPCTREELGLDGDGGPSARFFPPHSTSNAYIEKYWKKM